MPNDRMMQAIGRMERALAKLERIDVANTLSGAPDTALQARHEKLKQETRAAVAQIDGLLCRIGG